MAEKNANTYEQKIVVERRSENTLGIQDKDGKWYNYPSHQAPTADLKGLVKDLRKGDEITLIVSALDKKSYFSFIVDKKADGFEMLLAKAHKDFKDRFEIETTWLNAPDLENPAFKAKVQVFYEGEKPSLMFTGHGEATDKNTQEGSTKDAKLRMAETRAISRALRWLLNSGLVEEELPGEGNESTVKSEALGQDKKQG